MDAFARMIAHRHHADDAAEEFDKAVDPLGDSRMFSSFVRLGMRPSQRPCLGLGPSDALCVPNRRT
jgi:hypothetical protein